MEPISEMKKEKIIPIILCGGSGTRLWPLSRASFPKQYIALSSKCKFSLLQETILRISDLENIERPIFICNEQHRFLVAEQMREINIVPKDIILEPDSKNTCPAITLAALKANQKEPESILLVLSSDHLIGEKEKFLETLKDSIKIASKGKLVTFGIIPSSPETGYGYIKADQELIDKNIKCFKINKFIEKPNLTKAKKLIKDKNCTWNSGMFIFKTKEIIKEIQNFEPEILKNCKKSLNEGYKDLDFQRLNKDSFENCKACSFDVSIMEKTTKGVVMPLNVNWSDIGSWHSLWENEDKDKNGNFLSGNVFAYHVRNSYIRSDHRLIVANEIENLVVVETNDALLISQKDKTQNIKNIVGNLISNGYREAKEHRKIYRPWGNYTSIAEDKKWQVKRIEVKPGAQLSMQKHFHRAEHWVVVKGVAKVILENKESLLEENQSIFIPLGCKHRLSNPGKLKLVLIEVQSGNYLGEDDIIRFQDDYGRNSEIIK